MRKIFTISIILTICNIANAQELTLARALEEANSHRVENATNEVLIQLIEQRIQKNQKLPLLFGEANLQRNLIVPTTPVPAIAFNPNALPGEVIPLQFATDWTAKAGLQLSIDLYNPEKKWNNKQVNNQLKTAQIREEITKQNFTNELIDIYAQTYLAQKQLEFAEQNIEMYNQTFEIIKIRHEAGRASAIELNNAQKKQYELQILLLEAQSIYKNKLLNFSEYIDIQSFDKLSTNWKEIESYIISNIYKDSDEIFLEKISKEDQQQSLYNRLLPTITFNGYLGSQYYQNDLKLFNAENWFGHSYVNIALKLPISDWYDKNNKQRKYALELEIANNNLQHAIRKEAIENNQISNEVSLLYNKIQLLEKTVEMVRKNVDITRAKVEEGTLLISDYNNEMELYFEENKKLWQTQYEWISKQLNVQN